jgi:uncharacterized protein (DUF1778 family)
MHAATERTIYTETVGARVTPAMLAAIEKAAKDVGQRRGVWVRAVLAAALDRGSDTRLIIAKLDALRAILLTLQKPKYRAAESGTSIVTVEDLTAISDAADRKYGLRNGAE